MQLFAAPTPIPGVPQPTPQPADPREAWVRAPLVTVVQELRRGPGDRWSAQPALLVTGVGIGAAGAVDEHRAERGPDAFTRLVATSLADALVAATELAGTRRIAATRWGTEASSAIGVLQAADGAYYATRLGDLSLDPHLTRMRVVDVQAATPDLKAVVGQYTWVDLTTQG